MSNLVMHARRELELLGEDKHTIDGLVNMVQAFADMGHSGGSASVCIPNVAQLLWFRNLTPLTDDPKEWMEVGHDQWGEDDTVWQSVRRPDAFSHDGGKTYYLLDEGANATKREPLHTSRDHTEAYAEYLDRTRAAEERQEAIAAELPPPDPDVQVKIAEAYLDLKVWAQKMISTLEQHRMADRSVDSLYRAYALCEEIKEVWEAENAGAE